MVRKPAQRQERPAVTKYSIHTPLGKPAGENEGEEEKKEEEAKEGAEAEE